MRVRILADFNLAVTKADHQTTKFNSPPNFSAIRYVLSLRELQRGNESGSDEEGGLGGGAKKQRIPMSKGEVDYRVSLLNPLDKQLYVSSMLIMQHTLYILLADTNDTHTCTCNSQ